MDLLAGSKEQGAFFNLTILFCSVTLTCNEALTLALENKDSTLWLDFSKFIVICIFVYFYFLQRFADTKMYRCN